MSGWLLLGIGAALAVSDFLIGLYWLRRGAGADGLTLETPDSARAGRLIMFVSPLVLMVFALLAFGVIPVSGIEPIVLGAEDRS